MLTHESKYEIVGRRLSGLTGTVVDVGARDRRLKDYLPAHVEYLSADVTPGHDLCWNLEVPLLVPDGSYDTIVALDVLEHVELIHRAFDELLRVARRRVFVSLPNMACLSFRLQYLLDGRLSAKYDLDLDHQGDRHRWLTVYRQVCEFVECRASAAGCTTRRYDILLGYGRYHRKIARLPLSPALRAYTLLFEVSKDPS